MPFHRQPPLMVSVVRDESRRILEGGPYQQGAAGHIRLASRDGSRQMHALPEVDS